jgi:hypothetical protein
MSKKLGTFTILPLVGAAAERINNINNEEKTV